MRKIMDVLKAFNDPLTFVTPDTSISNAIMHISALHAEALPVLKAGKLVGIVSEKDCVNYMIFHKKSTDDTKVEAIMTANPVYMNADQTVEDCLEVMAGKHIRHLPILADGVFVGIVSINDVLQTVIDDQNDTIGNLENYILGVGYGR